MIQYNNEGYNIIEGGGKKGDVDENIRDDNDNSWNFPNKLNRDNFTRAIFREVFR